MSIEEGKTPILDNDHLMESFMEGFTPDAPNAEQSTQLDPPVVDPEITPVDPETPGENTQVDETIEESKSEEVSTDKKEFDINQYFEQSSEGMIKNEEDFKSVVAKAKENEGLLKQIETLKAEKDTIFANETVKTLNRLHKEGKSEEQISEYMRLSKLDIASLEPKEVLIQREISKGYTRLSAERIVEREYGLDNLSIDEDYLTSEELAKNKEEREFISERMKVDSDSYRKQLQDEFKLLSTEENASEKAIREAAVEKAYRAKLVPFSEQIQADFPKRITIGDDETGVLSYDVSQEFLDGVKEAAIDYFIDREVNPENVSDFMTEAKKSWLYNNQKEILTNFKAQVESATEKRVRAEFENQQGLPTPTSIPVVESTSVDDELMRLAGAR